MSQTGEKVSRSYERKLVDKAKSGDRMAVRELIDLHKDRLFAFIHRMIHHYHDAEEICQDAMLKAFASLDSFRTEYRFSTWLFTIGYRVCLNRMRRKHEVIGEIENAPFPDLRAEEASISLESEDAGRLRDMVWSAVDRLSPQQRATVLLFYRHELGCHEIAKILETPVATVKSHLHRARAKLKELLAALDEQEFQINRNRAADVG